jgi:hypothetical protein
MSDSQNYTLRTRGPFKPRPEPVEGPDFGWSGKVHISQLCHPDRNRSSRTRSISICRGCVDGWGVANALSSRAKSRDLAFSLPSRRIGHPSVSAGRDVTCALIQVSFRLAAQEEGRPFHGPASCRAPLIPYSFAFCPFEQSPIPTYPHCLASVRTRSYP